MTRRSAVFVRALRSEIAKLRRSRVLVSTLGVPAAFVILKVGAFAVRGEEGLGADRYTFEYLLSLGQFFWERLLVPLLAVTICSWLFWLEDESGQWKVLLTQPLPRGVFYLSKLTVAGALVLALQSFWWSFHALGGLALGLHGREAIGVAGPHALRVALALAPVLAVQLLLSALGGPVAALGIGIVGNTASLILTGTAINRWHPWGLAQIAAQPAAAPWAMGVALGAAAVLSWAGVVRFARKDI